jgi:hypothetical protein
LSFSFGSHLFLFRLALLVLRALILVHSKEDLIFYIIYHTYTLTHTYLSFHLLFYIYIYASVSSNFIPLQLLYTFLSIYKLVNCMSIPL